VAWQLLEIDLETDKPPETVLREAMSTWTGPLADNNFSLSNQSDVAVVYQRRYWPWYQIAFAIVLFPIGLLALLWRKEATITATVEPNDEGSILSIRGDAPKNVRDAFEGMQI